MNSLRNLGFPALVVLTLLLVWYSEVSIRVTQPPGPVHITYWEKWTGFEEEAMRAVVDEFNRSQKKIYVDLLTISGIREKTLLAVSGGQPPDVAGLENPDVAVYADARAAIPLDDYCRKYGIGPEQYLASYWNIGFYRGNVWALPTTPSSTALHYNRAHFRRAGLDPDKPPKTIEELDAITEKLTKRGPDGRLITSGFLATEPGWWNWGWGYFFGGKLWDGKDKITANSPENIRAYEWVQSYPKKYGASVLQTFKSGFGNFSSPQNAFLSEQVSMEIQGVWMNNFIRQYAPKLDWVAVPFPHPANRPDLANTTFVEVDVLMIPRGAKHPDEAFEFIRFVQSQKGMEMLNGNRLQHTPLKEISKGFFEKTPHPYLRLFADLPKSPNAIQQPPLGIWPEYLAELNNAFDEIVLLNMTPKEALDRVQNRMQDKLDDYLKMLKRREESKK